jgi:putative ABC transport system substrate-binding protein
MPSRRAFLRVISAALITAPEAVRAQQAPRVYRIGWFSLAPSATGYRQAFIETLRAHSFIEGRNLVIESRYTEGREDRTAALAAELVDMKLDLIVANYSGAVVAAHQATKTIPIVMVGGNPERLGLVSNLARPGGNLTGISNMAIDWAPKALQMIKDALPHHRRMGILFSSDIPASALILKEADLPTAKALRLDSVPLDVRSGDLDRAFETALRERVQVLYAHLPMWAYRTAIQAFADKHGIPIVAGVRAWTQLGALMSYGPDYQDLYERAAVIVVKIFNGAKPATIPIEQATRFDFALNRKTAQRLGLTLPQTLVAQANLVIE